MSDVDQSQLRTGDDGWEPVISPHDPCGCGRDHGYVENTTGTTDYRGPSYV